ncbi:HEAT repeat domain-containing protein, partial [Moorena producens]
QNDDYYVSRNAAIALGRLNNSSQTVVNALIALLQDDDYYVRRDASEALGKLGKTSNHVIPSVIKWIEQHQDSDYVGSGIDVLWDLVVGRESGVGSSKKESQRVFDIIRNKDMFVV